MTAPADLPGGTVPRDRAQLREHLVAQAIAGPVATPREANLRNYAQLADRVSGWTFGVSFAGRWDRTDVLALMAERVGVDPDPRHTEGRDVIDPDRTLDALDALGGVVGAVAAARGSVLLATGHPAGLLAVYLAVAESLRAAGCAILEPASGHRYARRDGSVLEVRYLGGVGMVSSRGGLDHTHSPRPMAAMLAGLAPARPDLVIADHGFAGAAAEAGVRTVGFADSNDPALFVAQAEGKLAAVVPLDDNVTPDRYAPLTAYLVDVIERAFTPSAP